MTSNEENVSRETAESFKAQMDQTLLSGFKLVGIALGIKLNLFDAFGSDPVTSVELAQSANLKERYVREWLYHMGACDVVEVDQSGTKFSLAAHRKDVLTSPTSLINGMGPAFSSMLIQHAEILSCFRQDGPLGIPFENFQPFIADRIDKSIPNIKFCADLVRDKVPGLRGKLEAGCRMLEVGSGCGVLLIHLAAQFPKSEFCGVDTSVTLTNQTNESMKQKGLTNVQLFVQDVTALPADWTKRYDVIVLRDVLHDIALVTKALENIHRCLKPGGHMSVFEVNVSSNLYETLQNPSMKAFAPLLYIVSTYHCLPASLVTPGSAGLGAGVGVEHISKLLVDAGFVLDGEPSAGDSANIHIQCNKTSD